MTRYWIVAPALAVVAMVLWVGSAFADAGPHGGYTLTSNCAGCHSTHNATADSLLRYSSAYELCKSCHNGSGAGLDVTNGVSNSGGVAVAPLKGGGFLNAAMNSTNSTPWTFAAAVSQSRHSVDGLTDLYTGAAYTGDTLWGIGAKSGTVNAGANFKLQCSTCHDPHGKSGANKAATYRILRSDLTAKVVDSGGITLVTTAPVTVPDTTGHKYTIDSATGLYYGQHYSSVNDTTGTDNNLLPTLSDWCATCHTRIHAAGTGTGGTSSGDATFTYRHATGGSSTEMNYGTTTATPQGAPACMTCHVSHGSSAAITSNSAKIMPKPGSTATWGTDSLLLRLNQRGVCEACHNK